MLIGSDFLWKAISLGELRRLLEQFSDDDLIYADRNFDLAVIRAANLEEAKRTAYPADGIVDVVRERLETGASE